MNPPNDELAKLLQARLEKVSELEAEFAPKGVNFSVRGQEIHTTVSTASVLRDPIGAADSVIAMLEDVKRLQADESNFMTGIRTFDPLAA